MSTGSVRTVFRVAFLSRLLVLSLIFLWRLLLHPYDTSASINPPCLAGEHPPPLPPPDPPLWPKLGSGIERSIVWDSVYFVRIAECGYEYEQTYAFFPILPILMTLLSRSVFAPLVPIIGYRAVLGLSGYVLSNVAFLFAALYFYRLSLLILKDSTAAMQASALFCFNPASIFYSSIYSESLYALFSLGGLYSLFTGYTTIAMFLLALSGSARSNGVLNAGYFCFQAIHQAYDAISEKKKAIMAVQVLITGLLQSICIFAPFVAFQAYGYLNICTGIDYDGLRPWCKARIPCLYDYIQSHYWGVGFMRYFQVKQLPNFLLASPVLSLAVCSIIRYVKLRPDIVFSLGFRASAEERTHASLLSSLGAVQSSNGIHTVDGSSSSKALKGHLTLRQRRQETKEKSSEYLRDPQSKNQEGFPQAEQGYFSISVLPFIYHLGFLTMTAFFVMYVQVASRFLSASPPIYWFGAYLVASPDKRFGYLIWVYFSAYILLGSLLFSNFYPFT